MARETRLASSSWKKVRSAAPARIIAIGLATFLPSSEGAVPCGASAITVSGFSSSSSEIRSDSAPAMEPNICMTRAGMASPAPGGGLGHSALRVLVLVQRDQERLRPRDGAEHLHDEVGDAVAVAVERRDDEGLAEGGEQQRVRCVYELGVVADVAVVLRGPVHLLLEHPLVDGGDGVLRAAEDLGPHPARLDKGELRDAAADAARDLLCPVGDLVEPLALAPLLGPVGVVHGHPYDGDGRVDAGHGVDAGDAPAGAHDHGPVYALPKDRVRRAQAPWRLGRDGRGLYAEAAPLHRRGGLPDHPAARPPPALPASGGAVAALRPKPPPFIAAAASWTAPLSVACRFSRDRSNR